MAKKKTTHKAPRPDPEDLVQAVSEEEEDEEEDRLHYVLLDLLPRSRRHPGVTLDELLDQWPSIRVPKPSRDVLYEELNPYADDCAVAARTGEGTPDDPYRYYLHENYGGESSVRRAHRTARRA